MPARPNIRNPAPAPDQEAEQTLWACDLRDGRGLAPGVLNDARNVRYPDGRPETRKGVIKPGWANRLIAGSDVISRLGNPYGAETFRDPNGNVDWQITAADGYAWRTRPYNQNVSIPLPQGVRLLSRCKFVQAFNKLFCFRGRYLAPLRLTNFDDGFEDVLDHWASAVTHAQNSEVFYGPFQEVSTPVLLGAGELTSASTTATVTHADHGLATGDSVTITGAAQAEYNGTYIITVTGTNTFTYAFAGSATTPATGTIYYVRSGLTRSGNTATVVTPQPHGYITGADVVITGAADAAYNGRVNVTVIDDLTFTYFVAGAPATPDVGTIKVSNMAWAYRSLGTLLTLTSLTNSGTTATATKNNHGFSNGQTVTIAGATGVDAALWNGTFVITNVSANTFDYTMTGTPGSSPAAGTITARNSLTLAGESPDTHPTSWQRIYDILPNADTALFTNNRLLVATAYTPGTTGYNSSAVTYTKVDFLVATDIQDEIHIDFSDEFRINQGSADEIVDLAKWSEGVVIVWKGKSWGVLTGVAVDLSNVAFDLRSRSYGLSAPGGWAEAGDNLIFVADKRGFVSIKQSESGKLIGVDTPLSAPIQKLIDRIDWPQARGIRLANWNSHLYAAVPLTALPPANILEVFGGAAGTGLYYQTSPGHWTDRGINAIDQLADGSWLLSTDSVNNYVAGQLTGPWTGYTAEAAAPAPSSSFRSLPGNNALLVFSFVSAAKLGEPDQGWCPLDTGTALNVFEWFKLHLDGVERLFYQGADGWINLMEESDRGDQIEGDDDQALGWEEIETRWRFRPQGAQLERLQSPHGANIALETFNPKYSLTAHFEGVAKQTVLATDVTRSNVDYFRPWNATPYDPTNYNNDHATPYREDYRVQFGTGDNLVPAGTLVNFAAPYALTLEAGKQYQFVLANATALIHVSPSFAITSYTSDTTFTAQAGNYQLTGGDGSGGPPYPAIVLTSTVRAAPQLHLHQGVRCLLFQESLCAFRLSGRQGRSVAIELINTQGRVRWQGILTRSLPGRQRQGIQT